MPKLSADTADPSIPDHYQGLLHMLEPEVDAIRSTQLHAKLYRMHTACHTCWAMPQCPIVLEHHSLHRPDCQDEFPQQL